MNLRRKLLLGAIAAALMPAFAFAQNAPYRIGTVLSVTGPGAFLGDHMKRGMELAIEEINAKGGINGHKIEWVFYDAETQASKAVTSTRRLIEQDKVDIIVGGGNASGLALAMVPIVEKAQIPFLSTEGSMQIVNPVAERQWTFKSTLDDDQVLERAADSFAKRGITSIAMLDDSSGFGQSAKEQIEESRAQARPQGRVRNLQPRRYRHDRAAHAHQGERRQGGHLLDHLPGRRGVHQAGQASWAWATA